MLPRFKRLSEVTLYTPRLRQSEELYRLLGLQPAVASAESDDQLVMWFGGGETSLVLHDDPQRQFIELTVSVEDVRTVYSQLVRDPSFRWIETPHQRADEWRAIVRLPDDNVFTLKSTNKRNIPEATERTSGDTVPGTKVAS